MAAFLDQSIFVSKKLTETIDNIIAKSDKLPRYYYQSDHGHFLDPQLVNEDQRKMSDLRILPLFIYRARIRNLCPKILLPLILLDMYSINILAPILSF